MHLQSIKIIEIVNTLVIKEYMLFQKKVCMIKAIIVQLYINQNPCKMSTIGLPLSTVVFLKKKIKKKKCRRLKWLKSSQ